MHNFEYAEPTTEAAALALLSERVGDVEILAGGTDLVGLLKKMVLAPRRVVNIMSIRSLRGVDVQDDGSVAIGAATPLRDVLAHPVVAAYPALRQSLAGINSMQLQAQGTLGGELCQRARCWYFRSGRGYFADGGRLVVAGDNRYHAIFDNRGPAKFVSGARTAPAAIVLDAKFRVVGPRPGEERLISAAEFFRTPRHEGQRETVLAPNQLLTHVILPPVDGRMSAAYEVRQSVGPDYPLASAAVSLGVESGVIRGARVAIGLCAPRPWISRPAEQALLGRPANEAAAEFAAEAAVAEAAPLSRNGYKVQLARVAVKRAIRRALRIESHFASPAVA